MRSGRGIRSRSRARRDATKQQDRKPRLVSKTSIRGFESHPRLQFSTALECVSCCDRFSRVPGGYLVFGKFERLSEDRDATHWPVRFKLFLSRTRSRCIVPLGPARFHDQGGFAGKKTVNPDRTLAVPVPSAFCPVHAGFLKYDEESGSLEDEDWPTGVRRSSHLFFSRYQVRAHTGILQGTEDFATPTSIGRAFVDGIVAPQKRFVTIKGGHFAVFMNSCQFLKKMRALLTQGTERLDRSQDHSYRHGRLLCVCRTARRSATAGQACRRRLAG